MTDTRKTAAISMIAGLVLAIVLVGGYKLYWIIANANANHQTQVINNGISNQSGLWTDMTNKLGDISSVNIDILQAKGDTSIVQGLDGQRIALVNKICADAANYHLALSTGMHHWLSLNCLAGAIKPGSPYDAINTGGG